jgi:hypothetical protein
MAEIDSVEIFETLNETLSRWTVGGIAASAAPNAWKSALSDDASEAELRLLAFAGQFLGSVVVTEVSNDQGAALQTLSDLPKLGYPFLPEELRPSMRNLLGTASFTAVSTLRDVGFILEFLATRGWIVSPSDWLPGSAEAEAPDIYARWIDWVLVTKGQLARNARQSNELNTETWGDFYPAHRLELFKVLRKQHPDVARALLGANLSKENASVRLGLVDALSEQLSEADVEFLTNLANKDIAPKVKARANALLAWLGRAPTASSEQLAELTGFFVFKEKKSGSGKMLEPNFKTSDQRERCIALLKQITFTAFAAAFNCKPLEMFGLLKWGSDYVLRDCIYQLAVQSTTDDEFEDLLKLIPDDRYTLGQIIAALPLGQRRTNILSQGIKSGKSFMDIFYANGPIFKLDDPLTLPAGKQLMQDLLDSQSETEKRERQSLQTLTAEEQKKANRDAANLHEKMHRIKEELYAIGMLASRTGAQNILNKLTQSGFNHIESNWLNTLRFNAALEDRGSLLEPQGN